MSRSTVRSSLLTGLVIVCAGAVAGAQQPVPRPPRDSMRHDMPHDMNHDMHHDDMPGMRREGPPPMRAGPAPRPGGVASMLLGQTAALKLTDQQVTRLAAIARSAESQQEAMRPVMDSMHRAMMSAPRGGGGPMQPTPAMESRMKAMHDQMHANVRDALAVLTPDQLATAWELRGGAGGMGMMGGAPMRMRQPKPE